jgi:hypothetical protein
MLEWLDKGNARILAAAAAVGSPLVINFGFERNAETFYSARISGVIEFYASDADARIVVLCDEPRKQVKLAIRAASGRRIQDAFDLMRIARFRLHQHSQAL